MTDTISSSKPGRDPVHPRAVLDFQTNRPARTIVHELLYAETPAVSMAPPGSRRGTLRYLFYTAAEAQACAEMHAELAVFTLTAAISNVTETIRYVVAGGDLALSIDPETQLVTILDIPFQEVPA